MEAIEDQLADDTRTGIKCLMPFFLIQDEEGYQAPRRPVRPYPTPSQQNLHNYMSKLQWGVLGDPDEDSSSVAGGVAAPLFGARTSQAQKKAANKAGDTNDCLVGRPASRALSSSVASSSPLVSFTPYCGPRPRWSIAPQRGTRTPRRDATTTTVVSRVPY